MKEEINFAKYYVEDADELREGYENSVKLWEEMRKDYAFEQTFQYEGMDMTEMMLHGFGVYMSRIMKDLYNGDIDLSKMKKDTLKFHIKRTLRDIKKIKVKKRDIGERMRVLVILYSSSETDVMVSAIDELVNRKLMDVVVIADGKFAYKRLEKEGIKYKKFDNYMPRGCRKKILKKKAMFEFNWKEIIKRKMEFKGYNIWELVKSFLWEEYVRCIEQYETIVNMYRIEEADMVITATEMSHRGKIDIAVGNKFEMKTIVVQHGAFIDCPYHRPSKADRFVVWGKITRDMLVRRGFDKNKLFIVGNPKYDRINMERFLK